MYTLFNLYNGRTRLLTCKLMINKEIIVIEQANMASPKRYTLSEFLNTIALVATPSLATKFVHQHTNQPIPGAPLLLLSCWYKSDNCRPTRMIGTPGLESAVARVSFVVFASTVQSNQYTPNPCPRHQNCAPESAENFIYWLNYVW